MIETIAFLQWCISSGNCQPVKYFKMYFILKTKMNHKFLTVEQKAVEIEIFGGVKTHNTANSISILNVVIKLEFSIWKLTKFFFLALLNSIAYNLNIFQSIWFESFTHFHKLMQTLKPLKFVCYCYTSVNNVC